MLNLDEVKAEIEERTGVPGSLLNGESVEELVAQAKALYAYKRDNAPASAPKSTKEQFAEWMNARDGNSPQDQVREALADIERRSLESYPSLNDGGEALNMPDGRSTVEQFSEWFNRRF